MENKNKLIALTKKYQNPSLGKSVWQIITTISLLGASEYLAYVVFQHSHILTIPFTIFIALLNVRVFCIQHDCGHGSFFHSQIANNMLGFFCSLIAILPYNYWRYYHAQHHNNYGKLEKRGAAEFYVLTTDEYLKLSRFEKLKYRILRHSLIIIVFVPFGIILSNILPVFDARYRAKSLSAVFHFVIIFFLYGGVIYLIGPSFLFWVILPALYLALMLGAWLFYIQHNFEHSYFKNKKNWEFTDACLIGSSYCSMPKVLQWFTANIGFHHIHHLNFRIPNYNLPLCHKENTYFLTHIKPIKFFSESYKTLSANLWDCEKDKMVSFKEIDEAFK